MDERPRLLSPAGVVLAVVAVAAVLAFSLVAGPQLFSPGGLNAVPKGAAYGGVSTHAQLAGRCGACHPAPWSGATMAQRCLACHTEVAAQMGSSKGLHARMAGTAANPTCRACHTEHHGPLGVVTYFDHSKLPFKLAGAHANIACDLCHGNASSLAEFRAAPTTCVGCHAKNDAHKGSFGTDCGHCHTPTVWTAANFDHRIFPINHGSAEKVATCQTCHPRGLASYSCFGCHAHTPARVVAQHEGRSLASLQECVRCHPGGAAGD